MPTNKPETTLSKDLSLKIHDLMVKSRVTEQRLIHIYKQGLSYFWIGGPGEEAFAVPLGLLINKGKGLDYDWLYLHYRCLPTLIAMGLSMKEAFRTSFNKVTDASSGGRNFVNHYSIPEWNVAPVSSVIGVQYSSSIGTAHVQKREKNNKSLTVVTGGDAGSHESDFATCLIWATRPKNELPILITVQNNQWGISTSYDTQHGTPIINRAKAFNINSELVDGNNPVKSYHSIKTNMDYIRETRRPAFIEANVSRLHGHSSATGGNYIDETCCIKIFEKHLKQQNWITDQKIKDIWEGYQQEAKKVQQEVMNEADPQANSIWNHIYANNENADWRKF